MLRYFLLSAMGCVLLCACMQEQQPAQQVRLTATMRNDSIILMEDTGAVEPGRRWVDPMLAINDSMMNIDVPVPPLLGEDAYDSATVAVYKNLGRMMHGETKILASSALITGQMQNILCGHLKDYADVLFLIDKTGSMADDIDMVRQGLNQVLDAISERHDVRLAIGCYADKRYYPDNWFDFRNFETDYGAARKFMDSIKLLGNPDIPESVYEGFFESMKQDFWKSKRARIVILIGDAAPLEKPDGEYSMAEVMQKARDMRVAVNFFPLIVTPFQEKYYAGDAGPKPAIQTNLISKVYPNPTRGPLHIEMTSEQVYHIELFDMGGMKLKEQWVDNASWYFDIGFEPDGLYVVRVSDKHNQYDMAKFIIRH